jgi:hypothetical protein
MKGRNMDSFQTLCRSAIVIWIWNGFSALGTVYQSDGSAASVQGLHDQVLNGDTITIPAGTFTWTSGIRFTKAITLQGQTTTNPVNGTAVDTTKIIDNLTDRNKPIIELNGNGGQRITGISFFGQNTNTMFNGGIRIEGGSTPDRIDHCHFHGLHCYPSIGVFAQNWGVLDHNVKDDSVVGNEGFVHFWPGAHTDLGDSLFEAPAGFGGPNFLFLEDNYMNGGTDITAGGKICARHNIIVGNNSFGSHGTGRTFPNGRGGRAYEIYNNEFRYNNNYSSLDGPDSGSSVYHDNTVTPHTRGIASQVFRQFYSFGSPFFGADGGNPWDSNDPQLYASGTLSSVSGANKTDNAKHWTTNQWVGYEVRRPSDGITALVQSNTATTLTLYEWHNQGWATGNSYEIRRVLRVLDQPGLGAGVHINRNSPAWPNPSPEPMYAWNNTNQDDGSHFGFTVAGPTDAIQAGRDYFNNTPMPGYVPYTYPHPLVSNATPTPAPTSTPSPSSTPTATPTATPGPTATVTPTPRPHPSHPPR